MHGFEAHISADLGLVGMELAVERFQEAIGLARLGPSNYAVEMLADQARDLLPLALGLHDVGAPLLGHCGNDVDLLAPKDVAQFRAIPPGTGGAFGHDVGDQGHEIGTLRGWPAVPTLSGVRRRPLAHMFSELANHVRILAFDHKHDLTASASATSVR